MTCKWPLSIRLEVLPGKTVEEKFAKAAQFGFDAVELPGRYLSEYKEELLSSRNQLALPISSISLGFRGSLVGSDPEVRRHCREDIKELLSLCSTLGARGLVMPPVLSMDNVETTASDGHSTSREDKDALLLEELPELADFARANDVLLMLEPVNRFETNYMTSLRHATDICKKINRNEIGITADFFHMQIEELDPAASILTARKWLSHIHVAENTRVEPGPGSLDFSSGFKALHKIEYEGFIVVECRSLSGPAEIVLPSSAEYLRRLIDDSQG